MAPSVTEILCILVDHNFRHTVGDVLHVVVPSDRLILDLKDKIKEQRQKLLVLIDAADLEVWRLRNPQKSSEIKRNLSNLKCLGEVLRNGDEDEGDDEVAWRVQEEDEILLHFSELPKNAISVLVRVPPPSQIGDGISGELHPSPYASLSCLAYTSLFKCHPCHPPM
jgi:hypothetical protein